MLMLVIVVLGAFVLFANNDKRNTTPKTSDSPSPDSGEGESDLGTAANLIDLVGAAAPVVAAIAGGTGATTATGGAVATGTAVGAKTATVSGASGSAVGSTAVGASASQTDKIVAATLASVSTGFALFLGIAAIVYIVTKIADEVLAGTKMYDIRFRQLADIRRIIKEANLNEARLLADQSKVSNVAIEETSERDYSLDVRFVGERTGGATEYYVSQGQRLQVNAPKPIINFNPLTGVRDFSALNAWNGYAKEASIISAANRQFWLGYAEIACMINVSVGYKNTKTFDASALFALDSTPPSFPSSVDTSIARPLEEWLYAWPMVNQNYSAPARSEELDAMYAHSRAYGKAMAFCQAFRLAKYDPTIWLASDAHLFPGYFLNRCGFANGNSFYFRVGNGFGLPNQPKESRAVYLRPESIGIDETIRFDFWDIKNGVGGIEVVNG